MEKKSDLKQLNGDDELQKQRREPISAPGVDGSRTNIPRLPKEEMLYRNKTNSKARKRAFWRSEQSSVCAMRDLGRKLSKAGDLILDFCASSCSTAKFFVFLDQHRKVVESDVISKVLCSAEVDSVLTFVSDDDPKV